VPAPAASRTHLADRRGTGLKIVVLFRMLLATLAVLLLVGHASAAAASPIRQLTSTEAANLRPAWSPDGKRIAFQRSEDDAYHVYVMDADGRNERRVTSGTADDRHPAWSPDGKLLAVDSGTDAQREIWVVDVAGSSRTQVTRMGAIATFPSWSPDGTRIAFYVYQGGAMDLWVTGRDGSNARRLTESLATENKQQCTFACHGAAWSPDGTRLALADGDSARVLLMATADGSGRSAITPASERNHFPVFLRDGRVVYVSEHVTQDQSWTDLWAVQPEPGARRDAVAENVQAQGPFELSPDGQQLLFASPRTGNFEIYAVTLDPAGKAALAQRPPKASDVAAAQAPAPVERRGLLDGLFVSSPYLIALVALGLVGAGIELLVRARRQRP
jgi:Tol biopolymer transport system component